MGDVAVVEIVEKPRDPASAHVFVESEHYVHNNCSATVPLGSIEDFVETCIVLKKDKDGLGLGIVGGRNTYLDTICVSELFPGGAASKDGRLRRGDILLEVNDVSLRAHTQAQAVQALRQAASPVKLRVLRENPETLFVTDDEPCRFVTVTLKKAMVTESLGLSLMGSETKGVFVTWVMPGSIAARKGRILQGDKILEINGQDVKTKSQKEVAEMLRNLEGEVVLLLGRVPTKAMSIQEWARQKMAALEADLSPERNSTRTRAFTWSYTTASPSPHRRPNQEAKQSAAVGDRDLMESENDDDQSSRMLLEFPLRPRVNTNVAKSPRERRPLFKLIRLSFRRSTSSVENSGKGDSGSRGGQQQQSSTSTTASSTPLTSPARHVRNQRHPDSAAKKKNGSIRVPEVVIHEGESFRLDLIKGRQGSLQPFEL